MAKSNIEKVKAANKIFAEAGALMLKTSIQTTRTIAGLYKEAGLKAFKFGGNLLRDTVKLAIDNQKNLLQASEQAVKETVAMLREEPQQDAPVKKEARKKKKAEVSIDDLLPAEA